ncbi:hypothetical protein ILUMI_26026 [Ignelater luminosus]|uniref:Uncharacterized protein n=1 Tax=Ignelater luminosus TaxID=2038154 RepID=A0A8K0C4Q8_IGNLU|nr:hypothetical protein ILUMI_26026 [Ignelater luminosus]
MCKKNNVSNETSAFPLHHDGTTDIFRKGLIIYFVLMALLACYHLIKCWRTNELSIFKPPRIAQNNNNCQASNHNPLGPGSEGVNDDAGIELHSIIKITEHQTKADLPPSYDEVAASTTKDKFDKSTPFFGD